MEVSAQDFQFISDFVRREAAIVLEPGKEYLVSTRLAPLARQSKLDSISGIVSALRNGADRPLATAVIEAMTTNESSFFRDIEPFEILRKQLVPEMIELRKGKRELSIWSAACSTGQEPYSLAMMLVDKFPQLREWKVNIVASDISRTVLDRAERGCFSQYEVNRGLPAPMLMKYFTKEGAEWRVCEQVRAMTSFHELNLIKRFPGCWRFDFVLMRNVLIYFDLATKQDILKRVRGALQTDGYLLLGAAETTLNVDPNFKRIPFEKTSVYQQTGG